MQNPLSALGSTYRDFVVTKYLPLNELQSTLIELVHTPSGARVIHIANGDPENLFCIGFQTLPSSSNGVAHILEHTTLCGSKKFPTKDPFFSMTRRSLNTYMNALTGQDFTCYPAASQVEKDFYNLLEVYLDAVFHPHLRHLSFLQEGHRLQFTKPTDPTSPLIFQGVVYNEMKGAMSSPESRLWQLISKHLTPDLTYAYNSGGEPSEIPNLTYEELLDFHKNFYHPSRAVFFFYGNLPLTQHLDFITEQTLEHTQKIPLLPPLPLQKRLTAPVTVSGRYPSTPSPEKADFISFSWLTAPISNQEDVLALSLLDSLLMDTDASPLKLALLKSGLCKEADSSLDAEMSEIPWVLTLKGASHADTEKARAFLFKTLEKIAKTPFDPADIEASLHQLEFERKEIGAEGMPFGLTLFFRAVLLKQHGSEPENGLLIHRLFSDLRERLTDPAYLPNILRKYILNNPHLVIATLIADPNLEKEEIAAEEKNLSHIRSRLTPAQTQSLIQQAKELTEYQESLEKQSLDCLPKLSLKDIPPHAKDYPLHETRHGPLTLYHHPVFTNKIVYADLILPLPHIPLTDLPLLSFFCRILTELGAGGKTYEESLDYQQAHVGSFNAAFALHVPEENPDQVNPTFALKGKALFQNTDKLFQLFSDYLLSPDFTDKKRIQELLSQHASSLQNRLVKNALSYAAMTSLSSTSPASYISSLMSGFPYHQTVLSWAKKLPSTFLSDLERIQHLILGGPKADLVLSCGAEEFASIQKHSLSHLVIPQKSSPPWKNTLSLPKREPQARFIPAPVAYTSWGMRTIPYHHPAAPLLLIATELFDNCVLHKEIREKGGAYNSGASYTPTTGSFYFHSYRDPHLQNTLTAFQTALQKISQGAFTDDELFEAKLGVLQTLDAPVPPGNRAATAYAWKIAHRTFERRDAFRRHILSATRAEIQSAIQTHLIPPEKTLATFIGRELFEKERPHLQEPLQTFPDTV